MWHLIYIIMAIASVLIITISRRKRMLANKIPGPPGFFLVGNLPILLQGPEKIIKNFYKKYRR